MDGALRYWHIITPRPQRQLSASPMRMTFQFRAQEFQGRVGRRVKAQGRRNQINQRRSGLQLHTRKIAITREIARFLMAADSRPIVRCLQWQVQIFGGLQFQNGEAARRG